MLEKFLKKNLEDGFSKLFQSLFLTYLVTRSILNLILSHKEIIVDYRFYEKNVVKPQIEQVINYFDYNKNGKIDYVVEFNDLKETILSGGGLFPPGKSIEAYALEAHHILKKQGKIK